jgi:hypothetical protein
MAWKGNTDNPVPNNLQLGGNVAGIKADENRALNIRRDQDSEKNFSVKLVDIDTAIKNYMTDVIDLTVLDNGQSVKVPVQYASQEKWKSVQQDGVLRDQQGKIQLPLIIFSRTSFTKNQELMTLNRHLTYPVLKKFDAKNRYDRFSILTNQTAPVHQVLSLALPDHVDVTYDFVCWTEYVEQLNTIVQKINFACEEYWGDPKRFKFRVYADSYNFETEDSGDSDRVVKATFTLKVKAYLLEESFESRQQTLRRSLTPRVIKIGTEIVSGTQMAEINRSLSSTSYKKPHPYTHENPMIPDGEIFGRPKINVSGETVDVSSESLSAIKGFYDNLVTRTSNDNPGVELWHDAPATSNSYGQEGWMALDPNYHYIYVGGQWRRQALSNWSAF